MPTIKTKKEMNLGELLCWAIENKEQARYRDFRSESMRVRFNGSGLPQIIFDKQFLPIYETFIVRTKEPITESTVIPRVLIRNVLGDCGFLNDVTINNLNHLIIQVYLMNDDDTIGQLIWTCKEGLVE
ncbi:hypothetical protein [Mammaliicoccus sciuri]|uniref:hypothetical protein n=1 Tax=Mammaliicoccus sciuri TaxID=1296 RepID=UPI002B25F357|nr:hypothetical protein [Mammaliicoccus sciuri]WQK64291.1 hypothetical protein P3U20_04925 [Mammaliicoccus sciuri]